MQSLETFPLPLSGVPPPGYAFSDRPLSELSTTTAFNTGIDQRDVFLGRERCVICGALHGLEYCHVLPRHEKKKWQDLRNRGWLPAQAKNSPEHDPRNGFLLCATHHKVFDEYHYFIRYFPEAGKYVFIDYSDESGLGLRSDYEAFHGKAIALDITDRHAPFPSLFIIHEMRVRGFHPFHDISPNVPNNDAIDWQDWVRTYGVLDDSGHHFRRHGPDKSDAPRLPQMPSMIPINTRGGGEPSGSGTRRVEFNEKVIADILAATRAMPAWKECVREGTSWTGTADENTQKYLSMSQDS